ncbi:DNA-binding transcriptional regulator, LysR family [Bosea lupini]|jgi:DNA-binding transcriptional LysR family regulator|uniref:DNA-binding transcriptional regulator, LysR family n=1 Tax=Bosea lupini TaxID=1036779 RepID=A0A1H8A013_9HYPH|nr:MULTISPECIES: LysR substrate-binding domain-containing protein [Bosea]SEM62907.1 DNA-binding transcriptional regulator, LysR family [Bosea lupini]
MSANFDMDALRAMVVGVELGSFARAATQLGRSQSAISMQLKKLEEQARRPLFRRDGRGLVPTEAGEALLSYARQIIALNDEAAAAVGNSAGAATVRLGLPQDFFEDVMPEVLGLFSQQRPNSHLEVRAGRNYALEEEVQAGRLDVALAFFKAGSSTAGTHVATLPLVWLAAETMRRPGAAELPLVLFDHPCLFRQTALQTLDRQRLRWRLALTTPSLPGLWAALGAGHGVSVRSRHRLPDTVRDVGVEHDLPDLPPIEVRLLASGARTPAAGALLDIATDVVRRLIAEPAAAAG